QVRAEFVEHAARLAEPREERGAVSAGSGEPFIGAPFAAHGFWPPVRMAVALGKVRIVQDTSQDARHVLVASCQEWHVSHAETQNRSHRGTSLRCLIGPAALAPWRLNGTLAATRRKGDPLMNRVALPPLISSDGHLEVVPERWTGRMPGGLRDKAPRTI